MSPDFIIPSLMMSFPTYAGIQSSHIDEGLDSRQIAGNDRRKNKVTPHTPVIPCCHSNESWNPDPLWYSRG